GWRNAKHHQQWRNTLNTYANPILGKLPVAQVSVGAVIRVLEPLWREKTETASRLRGRIESILDYATARGWRTGENPARWRDHRVPLSDEALDVLREVAKLNSKPDSKAFVFPGGKAGKPLSNMALLMLLRRMKRGDLTAHGFRSTFRDWCAEATNYPREVAEA